METCCLIVTGFIVMRIQATFSLESKQLAYCSHQIYCNGVTRTLQSCLVQIATKSEEEQLRLKLKFNWCLELAVRMMDQTPVKHSRVML